MGGAYAICLKMYGRVTVCETVLLVLFCGIVEMIAIAIVIQKFFFPNQSIIHNAANTDIAANRDISLQFIDRSKKPDKVLDKIYKVPLDRSISVVSFNEETQNMHNNLVRSAFKTNIPIHTSIVRQPESDLLSLPRSQVVFVFVDFNERNVILENPGQDLGDKKSVTVQAVLKMGADVFVVYFRDKGSKSLPEGKLYNTDLASFEKHLILKQRTAQDRALSVYETFTTFQKSHISKVL